MFRIRLHLIQCQLDIATLDIAAVLPIATQPQWNLKLLHYVNSDQAVYRDLHPMTEASRYIQCALYFIEKKNRRTKVVDQTCMVTTRSA